jgi:hypothetical protein
MVERSRRRHEMYDMTPIKMLMATGVLAAVAALFAGPAGAVLLDTDGGDSVGVAVGPGGGQASTIPYLSHGIGVDESLFAETATPQVESQTTTIPYLSHGIGVDESLFTGEQPSTGLTGDSALTRASASQPEGLTGDSPLGRTGITSVIGDTTAGASNDDDWTWVGLGSGLAALFAVAFGAMFLSARHRGRVALP